MRAIIFDIDGTLIDSMSVEPQLYLSAIASVLGPVRFRPGLEDYDHVTDIGIVTEVMGDNGIVDRPDAPAQIQTLFVSRLREFIARSGPFSAIGGAIRLLDRVRQSADARVAIATGSWRSSARLKLETSGFELDGIPLASCDDSPSRVGIMSRALADLGTDIDDITYFGDAEWDRQACLELGWDFVAVGPNLGGIQSYEGSDFRALLSTMPKTP